ncbi:MAG: Unknown protein [uncultured Sulfurovum sp.]|uniref:Uncharacterized protein n=1 Tax=uncultured Sulfurovum sp. TaxID=269237 RepID=A0A6S6T647_9BACT|nr:MAG: Unknown protein [uncultured Sulfurovum sp.]
MLKKGFVILFLLVLSAVMAYVYFEFRVPEGVTPMGDSSETIAWISLFTAIVSLITALIGLVDKILDNKKK